MKAPEKRVQQIERSALREAQKAFRKHPETPVTREELLSLRVQTLTLGDRITLAVAGSLAIAGGTYCLLNDYAAWAGFGLIVVGALILLLGAIGWRRVLAETEHALGEGILEIVLQTIIKALD
ncbi:MAG: hypothetical protein V4773_26060 [Verrucomicrobiota bacterium]